MSASAKSIVKIRRKSPPLLHKHHRPSAVSKSAKLGFNNASKTTKALTTETAMMIAEMVTVTQFASARATLQSTLSLLQGFVHRNANQHRRSTWWWGPLGILRRQLARLIDEISRAIEAVERQQTEIQREEEKERRLKAKRVREREERMKMMGKEGWWEENDKNENRDNKDQEHGEKKIKKELDEITKVGERVLWLQGFIKAKATLPFSQLVADNQFAPLGLMLVGVLATVMKVLGAIDPSRGSQDQSSTEKQHGNTVQNRIGKEGSIKNRTEGIESDTAEDFGVAIERNIDSEQLDSRNHPAFHFDMGIVVSKKEESDLDAVTTFSPPRSLRPLEHGNPIYQRTETKNNQDEKIEDRSKTSDSDGNNFSLRDAHGFPVIDTPEKGNPSRKQKKRSRIIRNDGDKNVIPGSLSSDIARLNKKKLGFITTNGSSTDNIASSDSLDGIFASFVPQSSHLRPRRPLRDSSATAITKSHVSLSAPQIKVEKCSTMTSKKTENCQADAIDKNIIASSKTKIKAKYLSDSPDPTSPMPMPVDFFSSQHTVRVSIQQSHQDSESGNQNEDNGFRSKEKNNNSAKKGDNEIFDTVAASTVGNNTSKKPKRGKKVKKGWSERDDFDALFSGLV